MKVRLGLPSDCPSCSFKGWPCSGHISGGKEGTENGLYAILGHHIRSLNLVQLFSLAGEET